MADSEMQDMPSAIASGQPAMPGRIPCHWLLVTLFAFATAAAFWQHGHAPLTVSMISAAFLFGLSAHVPMRFFNETARWMAQTLVALFAALWAVYRFKECAVEPDVIFTEFLCLAGISFLLSADNSRYKFINGISLVLIFYGAVFPRSAYIYAFPLILLSGLGVLYLTRAAALSGSFAIASPKMTIRRNWSFMLLHAALVSTIFLVIYQAFPFEGVSSPGLFFVSFRNNNDNYAPEDMKKWMNSRQMKAKSDAEKAISSENANTPSKQATAVSESLPFFGDTLSSGNGSAPAGDRLLFRVFSPVKLYWGCRIYDVYDGVKWAASHSLEKGKCKFDENVWRASESIEQKFRIEEWFSSSLPTAYLPVSLAPDIHRKLLTVQSSYGFRLPQESLAPATPFVYSVISRVPMQGAARSEAPLIPVPEEQAQGSSATSADPGQNAWYDVVPRKACLALPRKKLSNRLKELPNEICAKAQSPYAKAIALRDWLRNSFKYEQFSAQPKEGVEPVDYFIFELKKGHCEYFASALAVLARLEGLPARVVTGFSPGNFDAVNKCFNVYEYHAHAWTQIYIDGPGWLTFDATPPGQIVSRTTPYGLGTLQDPFGDEWRILPPELTKETQRHLSLRRAESQMPDPLEKAVSAPAAEALLSALMKIPLNREEIGDTLRELKTQRSAKETAAKKGSVSTLDAIKLNVGVALDSAKAALRRFANWVFGFNGLVISAIVVVVLLARALLFSLKERSNKERLMVSALEHFNAATAVAAADPPATIAHCYRMTRELLELAGCPRMNNMDLFDYGKSLESSLGPALSTEALVVFFIYSRSIYGMSNCTREDSAEALRRAIAIREMAIPLIRGS